jgi:hypothetical protein
VAHQELTYDIGYNSKWGRPGFDVGCKARGACRGRNSPRKICYILIVAKAKRNLVAANDAFYASAAAAA